MNYTSLKPEIASTPIDDNGLLRSVVVIILTYKQREKTLVCLSDLLGSEDIPFKILVWDNGSQDDTLAAVKAAFPNVLTHYSEDNLGVAGGRNASREKFRRALYPFLLSLDVDDQTYAMNEIRSWSELSSTGISTARAMSEEELLRLVDGGLIELGAHTRHHPMLPQLSFGRQKEEIQSSKRDLEALLSKKIAGFSYPNGRATVDAKGLVREMGFTYACTSLHDVVRPGSDVYELTRFWQKDVGGDEFLQGLRVWMKMSSAYA